MRFPRRKHRVAPVSKDGVATNLGFTRDRRSMCAGRASPTCVFETPRTRLRNPGRPKIAAPHHEGREEPACVKLIGIPESVEEEIRILHKECDPELADVIHDIKLLKETLI